MSSPTSRSLTTENALGKYTKSISIMNAASAREYQFRLQGFSEFVFTAYKINLDNLIMKINERLLDPYDVLSISILKLVHVNSSSK